MKKKRILIFSLAYYPRFVGGAEVAVKEITDRLGADFEFDMVTLKKHSPSFERIGNVNVYRVGWKWFGKNTKSSDFFPLSKYSFPFFALFKANSLNRTRNYDLIWSIMANYAGFGALFFKMLHPKVPFVLTLQEGDPIEYIKKRVGVLYPVFKKIFTSADIIQTISYYLADFARSMGYRRDIKVVANGVDIKHFSQRLTEEEILALKNQYKKKDNEVFLITTSRLVIKNAVDDIISSLKFLPDNIKLLIIGTGREEGNLKELVSKLNLLNRVYFVGFVPHKDLPKYLAISDIFIRPSLSEGFGNSFVEAMAAEVPVIATPVGGIVDFLFDPDMNSDKRPTGLFCEVRNPKSIADQVKKYLENPALREQIIIESKKMVNEKYDWDLIANKMIEVFSI